VDDTREAVGMKDRGRRLVAGLGVASLVWVVALVNTADAVPGTLACGATITQSTEVLNDVTGCSEGIIIGADNVVLDFRGHTLGCKPDVVGEGAGIEVVRRTGVVIKNGTVRDCDAGIAVALGSSNQILNMLLLDNIGELSAFAQTDFGDGIFVLSSQRNAIRFNTADHNGPYSGITLLGNSDNNVVEGNISRNNNLPHARPGHGPSVQEDDGLRLETISASSAPNFNQIRGNQFLNNGLDGVAVFPFANDNVIQGNQVLENGDEGNARRGDGIHIFGRVQRTTVSGNTVRFNARNGIRIDPTETLPAGGLGNRILSNTVTNNATNPGDAPAFDLNEGNPFCDGNLWQGNTFITKNLPGADCIH
jgi:hypothetical protein